MLTRMAAQAVVHFGHYQIMENQPCRITTTEGGAVVRDEGGTGDATPSFNALAVSIAEAIIMKMKTC